MSKEDELYRESLELQAKYLTGLTGRKYIAHRDGTLPADAFLCWQPTELASTFAAWSYPEPIRTPAGETPAGDKITFRLTKRIANE